MNRREFIKNVAVSSAIFAGAGLGLPSYITKEASRNIRWSMGWILWRDFSKPGIPLSEAVQNISDLGLDGIEFTPRKGELEKFGFTRESFRDLLKEKNLAVSGNYFSAKFYDKSQHDAIVSAFKDTMENLKFYGAKNVIVGPPGRGDGKGIPEMIRGMAPLLNELGKMARDNGLEIGLHPHVNTIVEAPDEIDLIMDLTDPNNVLIVPDTGHIFLGGGNVVEIVRKYKDRLNYFHLKDASGVFKRPNFGPNIRELGKGEVDFPSVMKILKEIKYKGWLNVEQDKTVLTPAESAAESMKYINATMKPIFT